MEQKETIKSVSFILSGTLLQLFNGIGDGWQSVLTAVLGIVLLIMGLNKLKRTLDEPGQKGVKMLLIAMYVSIAGFVFDLIPLMGIIAYIIYIAVFVLQLIGYLKLKKSNVIGISGQDGVGKIVIAMILGIVVNVLGLLPLPFTGIIGSILSILCLILVFIGWVKVQDGLIDAAKTA